MKFTALLFIALALAGGGTRVKYLTTGPLPATPPITMTTTHETT